MIAPASRFSNVAGAVTVILGARSRQLGIVSGRPNASASSIFILRLVPGSRTTAWRLSDQVRFGEDAESPGRTGVTPPFDSPPSLRAGPFDSRLSLMASF